MNTTIEYFNERAEHFFSDSFTITERTNQDRFLSYLSQGAHILDFGCGSGRDTAYFREHGFRVTPTDGSSEMCRLAAEYLNAPVRVLEFNELTDADTYDGIFASASIMHIEYDKLVELFPKMHRALHRGGILYASFKYGESDFYLGKRWYTNMTEERLEELSTTGNLFEIVELGSFGNEHPDQPDFRFLYVVLRAR